jgi:hypothetical protein
VFIGWALLRPVEVPETPPQATDSEQPQAE